METPFVTTKEQTDIKHNHNEMRAIPLRIIIFYLCLYIFTTFSLLLPLMLLLFNGFAGRASVPTII